MTTQTIGDLLERDIDDLVSLAAELPSDARNALLTSAAETLSHSVHRSQLKLLGFLQALAAASEPVLSHSAVQAATIALVPAAHADDPSERRAALQALAVLASRARELNLALTLSMLGTFEGARLDSSAEIRDFANEILSSRNPVFRRLIDVEAAAAGTGKLGIYIETLINSTNAVLDENEN